MANATEEDYYGFFNISKNASAEDINNAYRRFSLMYHPDKHIDEKQKKWAETIFNKTQNIYEVLSDPQKRSIYDVLGVKGLQTDDWKVVEKPRSHFHIREEYERLEQERKDQIIRRNINPKCTIFISINATDIFDHHYSDYGSQEIENIFSTVEISSLNIEHSIQAPVSHKDIVNVTTNISTRNGLGHGYVNISSQRNISEQGWAAMEFSVGNGLKYGIKCFHSLTDSIFLNGSGLLRISSEGIYPSFVSSLSMRINQNTIGYLTYKKGTGSSMTTSLTRVTEDYYTNVSVQFGIPHSFISASYSRRILNRELKMHASFKVGTFGYSVEYGLEKKISEQNNISGTVIIGVPAGVILKVIITREQHSFIIPIHVCEEVLMEPIFYATVLPIVSWLTLKHFIFDPLNRKRLKKNAEAMKEKHDSKIEEMRKEARWIVSLMEDAYHRIISDEEKVNGLIIIKAVYSIADSPNVGNTRMLNVTIPLQCLVRNSKLILQETSKAHLPGFYDIGIGKEKYLTIDYMFRCYRYTCTVRDNEMVTLPDVND